MYAKVGLAEMTKGGEKEGKIENNKLHHICVDQDTRKPAETMLLNNTG
jgi:hypothetical protein